MVAGENERMKHRMEIAEIEHMLLHALTEESVGAKLDSAKSQQEVYEALKTLSYFTLTMEEFQQGIMALKDQQAEVHEHELQE